MKLKQLCSTSILFCLVHTSAAFAEDAFGICSKLDFSDVAWSQQLLERHREPFALALNISGSFEGPEGWSNLASNFDGMGISLGLLNQNLGQGTLQPLFIDMRDAHFQDLKKMFTPEKLASVLDMLSTWEKSPVPQSVQMINWIRDRGYSELDDPAMIAQDLQMDQKTLLEPFEETAPNRNVVSVEWAKSTVLEGKSVKVDWASELKNTSASAPYRTIQIAEAEQLHFKALTLFNTFKMTQLRSYLFFFDIVVQNGGISDEVVKKYFVWLKANPKASGTTKLKKILEYRLPYVRKQYRADVRARKTSLINGFGRVHGHDRNYAREYCANINSLLP